MNKEVFFYGNSKKKKKLWGGGVWWGGGGLGWGVVRVDVNGELNFFM